MAIPENINAFLPEIWGSFIDKLLVTESFFENMFMITVNRTWAERLFSWPWRPWIKTKRVFKVPYQGKRNDTIAFRKIPEIKVIPYVEYMADKDVSITDKAKCLDAQRLAFAIDKQIMDDIVKETQ